MGVGGRVAALALLTACGRFGFGATDASPASADAPGNASPDSAIALDASDPCAGFDLCDGFEGATVDTSKWKVLGTVSIDSTVAHRGSSSVHMQIPALAANDTGGALISETATFAVSMPTVWVRAWVMLDSLPAAGNHLEVISAEQQGSGSNGDYAFVFSNALNVYSQLSPQLSQSSLAPPPTGTWFCMVWKVVRETSATGTITLDTDVLPSLALGGAYTDSASAPLHQVAIGPNFSGTNVPDAQPALAVWVDDVIVHHAALTCAD